MVCCSILVVGHLFCGWLWASEFWFALVLSVDFGLWVFWFMLVAALALWYVYGLVVMVFFGF